MLDRRTTVWYQRYCLPAERLKSPRESVNDCEERMGTSLAYNASSSPAGTGPSSDRDPLSIPSEVKASIRVLVVDDERTLRESCASVLQMDGYNVTLIGRGEEALETVKRRKFDIILVDLYMSQISGLDILRGALEAYRDTIVVVMTGNPSVTSSIVPSKVKLTTAKVDNSNGAPIARRNTQASAVPMSDTRNGRMRSLRTSMCRSVICPRQTI